MEVLNHFKQCYKQSQIKIVEEAKNLSSQSAKIRKSTRACVAVEFTGEQSRMVIKRRRYVYGYEFIGGLSRTEVKGKKTRASVLLF